ncbi:hypothetical protein [Solemya pervernicosa gill symbiont]|uniref:hypothetical protein n=1 Tax=Solemya pervernicosa gill symbiont TaxID=642797 RepID=UPI0009974BD4|nr:hypothetical protein [Solemya pervernicosa gill symbiont]
MFDSAVKDMQMITSDWQKFSKPIEGVIAKEVLHVPRDHGVLTEIFRPEWDPSGVPVAQIYQSGESLFLRKLVLGIQAQASGKYLTRPFMPTAPRFAIHGGQRTPLSRCDWCLELP